MDESGRVFRGCSGSDELGGCRRWIELQKEVAVGRGLRSEKSAS